MAKITPLTDFATESASFRTLIVFIPVACLNSDRELTFFPNSTGYSIGEFAEEIKYQ